jgi:RalA-binding protein 1
VPSKPKDAAATTREGFLTKKGQNMGRWVTRLYVLMGAQLDYYETVSAGAVPGAQVG